MSPKAIIEKALAQSWNPRETFGVWQSEGNGLSTKIAEPKPETISVKKDTNEDGEFEDIGYKEPPAKTDPNGPGLWEIIIGVTCTVTSKYENFASNGYTVNGEVEQAFSATITYHLDIPGSPEGQASSVLQNAITDITINGTVNISGKESGELKFEDMHFCLEEYKGQKPFAEYKSGTTTYKNSDVTDDAADLFEEYLEKVTPASH